MSIFFNSFFMCHMRAFVSLRIYHIRDLSQNLLQTQQRQRGRECGAVTMIDKGEAACSLSTVGQ